MSSLTELYYKECFNIMYFLHFKVHLLSIFNTFILKQVLSHLLRRALSRPITLPSQNGSPGALYGAKRSPESVIRRQLRKTLTFVIKSELRRNYASLSQNKV